MTFYLAARHGIHLLLQIKSLILKERGVAHRLCDLPLSFRKPVGRGTSTLINKVGCRTSLGQFPPSLLISVDEIELILPWGLV